jgi:hypothetical protein
MGLGWGGGGMEKWKPRKSLPAALRTDGQDLARWVLG